MRDPSSTRPVWDIIVVGARCAGASLGLLTARRGLRVLLVDKARLPSDTLSTHMVHESGVARMMRWDARDDRNVANVGNARLVERVRGSGCPALTRSTTDLDEFAYDADHLPDDGNAAGYCPRRTVLDPILADAAVAAGCELRTDVTFTDLVRDGDRVTGIVAQTRDGTTFEERARLVVGADGRRSAVARAAGAADYDVKPVTTCTYYTYWADTRIASTVIAPREGRAVVAVPTNDGLVVVTAIFPIAEFPAVKAAIEPHYAAALATSRVVSEGLAGARRADRFYGTADLPFHYRTAFGPGWALVGDAGHAKDPILARGISDALRDAEGLADAVVAGFSGESGLDASLGAWARERDAATHDMYEFTYRLSLLGKTSPLMDRVYRAARHAPRIASRFHGVVSGALAYRDFFVSRDADEVIRANS